MLLQRENIDVSEEAQRFYCYKITVGAELYTHILGFVFQTCTNMCKWSKELSPSAVLYYGF